MDRRFYLGLAAAGLRMPIGADLVLNEQPDPEAVARDGRRLGRVLQQSAKRYRTPLAFPLMDLRLEKADLAQLLGVAETEADTFQFDEPPSDEALARVAGGLDAPFPARSQAHIGSVAYIAAETELVPIGMAIGPFSLMTKLVPDPITPLALAGRGVAAEDDPGVRMLDRALALAEMVVGRAVRAQAAAGARAMLICEPAANVVYISPKQIAAGADTFERFVVGPNLRLKSRLDAAGVDLIFHDCGQLAPFMVEAFGHCLHPKILSLGSSRKLWEDAGRIPSDVVLFGNLPTKSFYSDADMPLARVEELTRELIERMRATGHPLIPGSECDVLHVPDAAATIRRKVRAMLECGVS